MDKTNLMVEFNIYGDEFDPEEITLALGVEPTEYHLKGSKGTYVKELKNTCWTLSTGYVETLWLSDLLDEIVDKLADKKEIIFEIKKKLNVECGFSTVANIVGKDKPTITIEKKVLEFANYLDAEIDCDLYIYEE